MCINGEDILYIRYIYIFHFIACESHMIVRSTPCHSSLLDTESTSSLSTHWLLIYKKKSTHTIEIIKEKRNIDFNTNFVQGKQ